MRQRRLTSRSSGRPSAAQLSVATSELLDERIEREPSS